MQYCQFHCMQSQTNDNPATVEFVWPVLGFIYTPTKYTDLPFY